LFSPAEWAFRDFRDTEGVYPAHFNFQRMQVRSHSAPKGGQTMENDMISKITAIVAVAVVLASASVASAQTVYAPSYHNPYYNQDTKNLRYGHANDRQFDPYRGTVFEGVAPY
jgi:hypothetical protein